MTTTVSPVQFDPKVHGIFAMNSAVELQEADCTDCTAKQIGIKPSQYLSFLYSKSPDHKYVLLNITTHTATSILSTQLKYKCT